MNPLKKLATLAFASASASVLLTGCAEPPVEAQAPPGIESAIWHYSVDTDTAGNRPCIDVQLSFQDGTIQQMLLMSLENKEDPEQLCMGKDPYVEWAFKNGKEEAFRVSHQGIF